MWGSLIRILLIKWIKGWLRGILLLLGSILRWLLNHWWLTHHGNLLWNLWLVVLLNLCRRSLIDWLLLRQVLLLWSYKSCRFLNWLLWISQASRRIISFYLWVHLGSCNHFRLIIILRHVFLCSLSFLWNVNLFDFLVEFLWFVWFF